jgi:hypothetical protein
MVNKKLVNLNMASEFKKVTNSINFTYYMLSDICYLLHVYCKIMKLNHKISLSVHTCFILQGYLVFRNVFLLGKFANTLVHCVKVTGVINYYT